MLFYSVPFNSIPFYSILLHPVLLHSILFHSIIFYSILFYFFLLVEFKSWWKLKNIYKVLVVYFPCVSTFPEKSIDLFSYWTNYLSYKSTFIITILHILFTRWLFMIKRICFESAASVNLNWWRYNNCQRADINLSTRRFFRFFSVRFEGIFWHVKIWSNTSVRRSSNGSSTMTFRGKWRQGFSYCGK